MSLATAKLVKVAIDSEPLPCNSMAWFQIHYQLRRLRGVFGNIEEERGEVGERRNEMATRPFPLVHSCGEEVLIGGDDSIPVQIRVS
jgi:hypothetical protein